MAQLSDRRRLPGSVHADDEDHRGAVGEVQAGWVAEEVGRLPAQRGAELADIAAGLEPLDELRGRGDTHVGGNQRFLQAFPGLVVAGIEGGRSQLLGERAAALAERVAEAREEALLLRFGLVRRLRVAEKLAQLLAIAAG